MKTALDLNRYISVPGIGGTPRALCEFPSAPERAQPLLQNLLLSPPSYPSSHQAQFEGWAG